LSESFSVIFKFKYNDRDVSIYAASFASSLTSSFASSFVSSFVSSFENQFSSEEPVDIQSKAFKLNYHKP
jgi:hypothetical protein